jgi:SAM-dependent methyltransferase
MSTNFGAAAEDYRRFRAGFPDSFFDRLRTFGIGDPGTLVIDIGTGTGALARGFVKRGARAIGIDPDERMLTQARQIDADEGHTIDYRVGRAEQVPLPDACADLVSAGQCWHWFDGPKAAREFARVVKAGGCALVAHFDWLPIPGSVVEATERLIKSHNPSWRFDGGNGFHPASLAHLYEGGFRQLESFSYDVDVPYSHEAWRGRIRASVGVAPSLDPSNVAAFDAAHARLLAESFPGDVIQTPHRVFAVVGRYVDR